MAPPIAPPPTLAALAFPGALALAQHRLGLQRHLGAIGKNHGVEPHAKTRAFAHLAPASTTLTEPSMRDPGGDGHAAVGAHVARDARFDPIFDPSRVARQARFQLQSDDGVGRDRDVLELWHRRQ
jgi:hypothetical protein